MAITVLPCNLSKYLPFINLWGKFHPKICCSPYLLRFSIEIQYISVNLEKTRWKFANMLNKKFLKIIAFHYDQHLILIRTIAKF